MPIDVSSAAAGHRGAMTVLLYHHDACLLHDTGENHPERPQRLTAALAGARSTGMVTEVEAPLATVEDLTGVHTRAYVVDVEAFLAAGGGSFDPDTAGVPDSWEAALRAVGAGLAAARAMESGDAGASFLAVRPPGHHALADRAMGFCLFNNAAVLADRLSADGSRVAIVDWDVHHGNGTQDIFYERDDVLYLSVHEFPFYPLTGWVEERGAGPGGGFTVNVPLPAGEGGQAYRQAFDRIIEPTLREFSPDVVVVSAGYDAHAADPLANMRLAADDYGHMAFRLASLGVPVIAYLEGGYDLEAIEASVAATVRGLSGEHFEATGDPPKAVAQRMITESARVAGEHWDTVSAD